MTYLVETPDKTGILGPEVSPAGQRSSRRRPSSRSPCRWPKPAAGRRQARPSSSRSRHSSAAHTSNLCQIRSFIWNVPITFSAAGGVDQIALSTAQAH